MRGADVLARSLEAAGVRRVFTLSGNHIMEVFDALVGSAVTLVHTRHEAAAVHMADAYARLSGEVGVALVTGGPGHANAVAPLYSALAGEVPVLLLSGHAPLGELGDGAFQEVRQADLAAPLAKASWTVGSAAGLAEEFARAVRLARSGRPGPVHLSLPTDVLEAVVEDAAIPADYAPTPMPLGAPTALLLAAAVAAAARPVLVAPPALCTPTGAVALAGLESASGLPVVAMQSVRGLADPSLGAFAEVLAEADLVVLLGKPLDFTLRFGRSPATAATCRWIVLDPDAALIGRAGRLVGNRLLLSAPAGAAESVAALGGVMRPVPAQAAWADRLREAMAWRPPAWRALAGAPPGPITSATLCHAVQAAVAARDATFVCDGGEIGQWGLALVSAGQRVGNGVAGAIGVGIPFAIGARAARDRPTIALMGDGSFGFHMAELDTAVRHRLPFVAVVGNDSRWNAEHQIQLRDYGRNRAHGCDLAPGTRYDQVAAALGGHGEWVTEAHDLAPALDRALASGVPAVVNVMIEAQPAPLLRR